MKKEYLMPRIREVIKEEKLCNPINDFLSNWHMAENPEGEADEDIF